MGGRDTQMQGMPLWAKALAVIGLLLVLLVVVLLITGQTGGHGPGRHAPGSSPSGSHTGPPAGVTHAQP